MNKYRLNGPHPLITFKDKLLKKVEVIKSLKNHYGEEFELYLKAFKNGSDEDIELECILNHDLWESSATDISFEGAGPEDDTFFIQIMKFGPLYFIQADEFDDIKYFDDLNCASAYAQIVYEPYITALEDRNKTKTD
jgi:hypothetical protein